MPGFNTKLKKGNRDTLAKRKRMRGAKPTNLPMDNRFIGNQPQGKNVNKTNSGT